MAPLRGLTATRHEAENSAHAERQEDWQAGDQQRLQIKCVMTSEWRLQINQIDPITRGSDPFE
jgi:hypothetical protein